MGKIDVIPLLPLLGVNHRQPILYMSKILVYLYGTDKHVNQFSIGYMINPKLHDNKVFREQVKKYIRATFHQNITESIRNVMRKKNKCVIALIIFYESKKIQ